MEGVREAMKDSVTCPGLQRTRTLDVAVRWKETFRSSSTQQTGPVEAAGSEDSFISLAEVTRSQEASKLQGTR